MRIKTRRYYFYYLLRIFAAMMAVLPVRISRYLGGQAGKLAFCLLKKERQRAIENLRSSLKDKSEAEIEKIAKGVFCNLGKNAGEIFQIYKINRKNLGEWVTVKGKEKLERALGKGRGVIMLTAHFGNWELISIYFALLGYKGNVIGRRLYFDKYDRYVNDFRRSKNVNIIYRDESPKKILRALKDNGIIGMLADQDVASVDGVFVDFFGRPAYTPTGPVAIKMASKTELLPCFIIRNGDRHEIVIEDPIEMEEAGSRDETLRINTQKWSDVVESYIRRYPDHWVWMHRRWKTTPEMVKK